MGHCFFTNYFLNKNDEKMHLFCDRVHEIYRKPNKIHSRLVLDIAMLKFVEKNFKMILLTDNSCFLQI